MHKNLWPQGPTSRTRPLTEDPATNPAEPETLPGTFTEYDAYRRQQLELGRDIDADEISDEWWQTGRSA